MDVFDKFFKRYSYKFPKGYPDMKNEQDVLLLENILYKKNQIHCIVSVFLPVYFQKKKKNWKTSLPLIEEKFLCLCFDNLSALY